MLNHNAPPVVAGEQRVHLLKRYPQQDSADAVEHAVARIDIGPWVPDRQVFDRRRDIDEVRPSAVKVCAGEQ